jgi:hypothetical protein
MEDQTIILVALAILAFVAMTPNACSCVTEDDDSMQGFGSA